MQIISPVIAGDIYLQAQIVELDPAKPDRQVKILTSEFYSARSPQISYDGKYMLFCAQQKQTDPWQIWEMDLKNLKTRTDYHLKGKLHRSCLFAYWRMVFSKFAGDDKLKGRSFTL